MTQMSEHHSQEARKGVKCKAEYSVQDASDM